MKRSRKLLILALVLLALGCGTLIASKMTVEPGEVAAEEVTTILTLDPDTVTALRWTYSVDLGFFREGEIWRYEGSDAFPVDGSYLQAILDTLSRVESAKTIESIDNWDAYGLKIPVCTISVTADKTYDLAIGTETTLGGQRYFSIGDGKAYLVDSAILEPFQYGLYDLMAEQTMPQVEQVTAMTVTTPEGSYTLTFDPDSGRTYSDDYVWFWEDTPLDTGEATSLVGVVTQLSLSRCENYDAADLGAYGLDTPSLTATVYDGGAEAYTLGISEPRDGECYVNLPGTAMVFSIDDAIYETLRYTTAPDLTPTDVLRMDWDTVSAVTLTLGEESGTFTRGEDADTGETIWQENGEEAALGDILTGITDLSATGSAAGLTPTGEPRIVLEIRRERETFPHVTLAFYPYSSENCLVTLEGEATVTVARRDVADLVAEVSKLLEN